MPSGSFDIHQTARGYVAVTSPIRRRILDALTSGPQDLAALMATTHRSKPALSLQLKQLAAEGLVEEVAHPSDSRRKRFRLSARRIGSSDIPLDALRGAIREYVSSNPLAARFPLTMSLEAIGAAPAGTPGEALRSQARRLGELTASAFAVSDDRRLVLEVAGLLDREGIAQVRSVDAETRQLDLEASKGLSPLVERQRLAWLVGAFVEGVFAARGPQGTRRVEVRLGRGRRFRLRLRGP